MIFQGSNMKNLLDWRMFPFKNIMSFMLAGLLSFVLMGFSFFQPSLNIDADFNELGSTQVFYPNNGGFSERDSTRHDITPGVNNIRLHLPGLSKQQVRWDPFNGNGDFVINGMSIKVSGLTFSISPEKITKKNEIYLIKYQADSTYIETTSDASDPSLFISLPKNKVLIVQISTFLMLILLIAALIIKAKFLDISSAPIYKQSYLIAGFSAVFLTLTSFIVGTIAVGNGTGWDGGAYIAHVELIAAGIEVGDDPYRMSRMGGFIPAIIAAGYGLSREALISFQVLFNIALISVGLAYFYDFLRVYGVKNKVALISTSILLFSWPVLVLPVYYPILSDHLVLVTVCLSLWFWIRGNHNGLYILCLWTPWIMPLLVLVPMILASMPYSRSTRFIENEEMGGGGLNKNMLQMIVFLLLALCSIFFAWLFMSRFSDEAILVHAGVKAGMPELRIWSAIAVCISLTAIMWVWAQLINSRALFYGIQLTSMFTATVCAAFSYIFMKLGLDWSTGFTGPNILNNIFVQSLSAPFKPYIANFLYFGPVFFVALTAFSLKNYKVVKLPWPLITLFAGFLPLLVIGSESRQWLAVFPIFVALFALLEIGFRYRVICFIFAIILCLPAFGLSEAINHASESEHDFLSSNWQYYFGRQGPWMSPVTYIQGMILTLLFFLAIIFLGSMEKKEKKYKSH
jgi:hypothetical protein